MKYDLETPDLPPVYSMAKAPAPSFSGVGIPEGAAMGDTAPFTPEQAADNRVKQIEEIIASNYELAQYDGVGRGKQNAMEDAAEARIKNIKAATGQDIPNPYRGGFMDEALSAYAKENPRFLASPIDANTAAMPSPYRPLTAEDLPRVNQIQMQLFQSRLSEMESMHPDKTDVIGATRPIDADAREIANTAQRRASAASSATTGLVPFAAGMVGGMAGSWRDPIQVGSLFVGGAEVRGGTALYRIARAAAEQAAINTGAAVLEQPAVQAWRKERGQESGLTPALKDIGMAALFGAIPGAGIEAGKIGWQKFGRQFFEGEPAAVQAAATNVPREMSPELFAARQAQWADDYAKMSASIHPAFEPLDYAQGWESAGAYIERAQNRADAEAIDNAARSANPELFSKADQLDAAISSGRESLASDISRIHGMERPEIDFVERMQSSLKQAESAAKIKNADPMPDTVEELYQRALALPGTGNAKFRRAADEFEQLHQTAQQRRWPEDDSAVIQRRMELNDLQRERALLGPKVAEARQAAAGELGLPFEHTMERDAHKEALADAYAQSIRHLEDPAEPMAEAIAPPAKGGRSGHTKALDEARTPLDAADNLRADPDALKSALVSPDPKVRDIAKLATLSDDAYAMVRNGDVSPAVAIEVASRTPNMGDQAAILREVAESRPATRHEAAVLTTEAVSRKTLPDELSTLLGSDEPPARTLDAPPSAESIIDQQWAEVERMEAELPIDFGGEKKPAKDSLDTVPSAERMDGSDTVALTRDEMIAREPREGFLAGVVAGCPGK